MSSRLLNNKIQISVFTSLKCNNGVIRPLQSGEHGRGGAISDITVGGEDQVAKNRKFKAD